MADDDLDLRDAAVGAKRGHDWSHRHRVLLR
jgi:hypothetical protein